MNFMTATQNKLAVEILALPGSARAFLAHQLIHSLEERVDEGSEIEWIHEIDRRTAEIRQGKVKCIENQKAVDSLRKKLHVSRCSSSLR